MSELATNIVDLGGFDPLLESPDNGCLYGEALCVGIDPGEEGYFDDANRALDKTEVNRETAENGDILTTHECLSTGCQLKGQALREADDTDGSFSTLITHAGRVGLHDCPFKG